MSADVVYSVYPGLIDKRNIMPTPAADLRSLQSSLSRGHTTEFSHWHTLNQRKRLVEVAVFAIIFLTGFCIVSIANTQFGLIANLLLCTGTLLMGIAYNSLGLFLHEGLHGTLTVNKKANLQASFLVALPLLISASAYRLTHTYHHIELGRARDFGTYQQHTKYRFIVWLCYYLQLIAGSFIYILFIPILAWRHANRNARKRIIIEYLIIVTVAAIALLTVPLQWIFHYWLLPLLVMNVLTNIRGLASHALGRQGDPLLASRTIHSSPLTAWLMLYENYHLAHHLFPKVPSYYLHEVHSKIWDHLPRACDNHSYGEFLLGFIYASFRNDLRPLGLVRPARKNVNVPAAL